MFNLYYGMFESSEKLFEKCKFKFEPISLGDCAIRHIQRLGGRCVTYNASNLMMVLQSSLKREPAQSTTLWRLEIESWELASH